MARFRTRFAPSPTGYLHLGHAFSALTAWGLAEVAGGECLLRIEDLDGTRARPEFDVAIEEDLRWLGLDWPKPVVRQSEHLVRYDESLGRLADMGLTYPCSCTRADIRAALSAPQASSDVPPGIYPGTCRGRPMSDLARGDAVRLDLAAAFAYLGSRDLVIAETGPANSGRHTVAATMLLETAGDVVLARKDTGAAAYHLAVVVDDAWQGVTHVVRGEDLWDVTPLHRLLQALLELPAPVWHHHALVRDEEGRRLAKRDGARALRTLRLEGATPGRIRAMLGLGASGPHTGAQRSTHRG